MENISRLIGEERGYPLEEDLEAGMRLGRQCNAGPDISVRWVPGD